MKTQNTLEPESQAERPLWQMDLRHKLDLKPGQNDPISMLLWSALYGSESQEEFEERVENHISELLRALVTVRER